MAMLLKVPSQKSNESSETQGRWSHTPDATAIPFVDVVYGVNYSAEVRDPGEARPPRRRMTLSELDAAYEAAMNDADFVTDVEQVVKDFEPTIGDGLAETSD